MTSPEPAAVTSASLNFAPWAAQALPFFPAGANNGGGIGASPSQIPVTRGLAGRTISLIGQILCTPTTFNNAPVTLSSGGVAPAYSMCRLSQPGLTITAFGQIAGTTAQFTFPGLQQNVPALLECFASFQNINMMPSLALNSLFGTATAGFGMITGG